jgi:hypothetical protein
MRDKERAKFTTAAVSVNVVFKEIKKELLSVRRSHRGVSDERHRDNRQCSYISMCASSIGVAMLSTLNKIGDKGKTLTKTLKDLCESDDLPTSIINPCLNEWVLSVAIPAMISIVEMWDLGFKDMLKTMYFSFPHPTDPTIKKSLQSFATECRLTNAEKEQGMKMFEQGGFLFVVTRVVQNCADKYNHQFSLDWQRLKVKILQIHLVYDRITKAFHEADKKNLCRTNGFLNCDSTEHCDAVEEFIDKYNNVYKRMKERKLESTFLPFYEALFKVEAGVRTIEWFDNIASRYFESNSDVCKAIQSIKSARESTRQPPSSPLHRRSVRTAAIAAAKSITETARKEAPSDSETEIESDAPFISKLPTSDDDSETKTQTKPTGKLADEPKTNPEKKKRKGTSRAVTSKKSQYDVDHVLTKAKQTVSPGQIYFHCPYCDAARVISDATNGLAQVITTTDSNGAKPVDQTIEQPVCRKMTGWTKFRKHIQQCWMRRRGIHHPEQLAKATADKLYMEELVMPPLFQQKKVKYSKKDTIVSATGKRNYAFYRQQSEQRKKQKILAEARNTWTN